MFDDGVIKFHCTLTQGDPPETIFIEKLNSWRSVLFERGLIGQYDNGVSYGNISRRFRLDSFIISGSATGLHPLLSNSDYVLVTDVDVRTNSLHCQGLIQPSSESLTHGIIYQTLPEVRYVLHVHHGKLWHKFKNILPTTALQVAYGTPEMALEVKHLIQGLSALTPQILIMGGHVDGIIAYGKSLEEVGQRLLKLFAAQNDKHSI